MRDRIVRIQIVPSLYLESKSKDPLLVRIQYRASVVQLQVRKNQIIATLKYLYLGFVRYFWVSTYILATPLSVLLWFPYGRPNQ